MATSLGDDILLLHRLKGRESLGRLFSYHLELLSETNDLDLAAFIGQPLCVRIERPVGGRRFLHGMVNQFVQTDDAFGLARYEATVVPAMWGLTQMTDCRIFQDLSAVDVVRQVLQEHAIRFDESLSREYAVRPYCVQYCETTFDFVQRLLEEEGIYSFFEHEENEHRLILVDSVAAHESIEGYERIPYSHDEDEFERVFSWRQQRDLRSGAFASTDFDFNVPKKMLEVNASPLDDDANSNLEVFAFPGKYTDLERGQDLARVRVDQIRVPNGTIQGCTTAHGLATGAVFSLDRHPRDDQNSTFLVVETEIELESDLFGSSDRMTRREDPSELQCRFKAIDTSQQVFRPERTTARPIIHGLQTALVVGDDGEEIATDEFGRIRVMFHWDRYASGARDSSCAIRVATQWAGKKWGKINIPRVGQEVIVAFEEGDPDRPLIIGSLFNGDHRPPYELPKDASVSTTKSQSTPDGTEGHELRFQDKKGLEQLFLHAKRRMDQLVSGTLFETSHGSKHVRVGGKKSGDLRVLANQNKDAVVKKDVFTKVAGYTHALLERIIRLKYTEGAMIRGLGETIVRIDELDVKSHTLDIDNQQMIVQSGERMDVRANKLRVEANEIFIGVGENSIRISESGIVIQGQTVKINNPPPLPVDKTDPPQVDEIAGLLPPFEASSATSALPSKSGRGGGGRSRTRGPEIPMDGPDFPELKLKRPKINWPDPPPPPVIPPVVCPDVCGHTCELDSIKATCEHHDRSVRTFSWMAPTGRGAVLEVVPHYESGAPMTIDHILLEAETKDECGLHPVWSIQTTVSGAGGMFGDPDTTLDLSAQGPETSFEASNDGLTPVWDPGKNRKRRYAIKASACEPSELKLFVDVMPPPLETEMFTTTDDVMDALMHEAIEALVTRDNYEVALKLMPKNWRVFCEKFIPESLIPDQIKLDNRIGDSSIFAQWEERESGFFNHTVWYRYDVNVDYDERFFKHTYSFDRIGEDATAAASKEYVELAEELAATVISDRLGDHLGFFDTVFPEIALEAQDLYSDLAARQILKGLKGEFVSEGKLKMRWVRETEGDAFDWKVEPEPGSYGMKVENTLSFSSRIELPVPRYRPSSGAAPGDLLIGDYTCERFHSVGDLPPVMRWPDEAFRGSGADTWPTVVLEFTLTFVTEDEHEPFIDEDGFGVESAYTRPVRADITIGTVATDPQSTEFFEHAINSPLPFTWDYNPTVKSFPLPSLRKYLWRASIDELKRKPIPV